MKAEPEARAADAHGLVDARDVGAAHQHGGARGARFERLGGGIDRGGAGADHRHGLAAQGRVVDRLAGMRPKPAVEPSERRRHVRAAETVAAGREHQPARRDLPDAGGGPQGENDGARVAVKIDQLGLVLDRHFDHRPVPAQIVHPLQARNPVQPLPCGAPELRLEPGPEREVGEAERRAGQLRRRAQDFHARMGRPRPLETLRRAIEHPHGAHAQALEREGGGETRHAGADDRDVEHRPPLRVDARLEPLLGGRQREQLEVAGKPRLQLGERARPGIVPR